MHIPSWSDAHNRGFIGGFYIRPFEPLEKGQSIPGHKHHIDHLTFVEEGTVLLEWEYDGQSGKETIEAPNFIHVPKNAIHKITALTDGARVRCLFAQAEAEKIEATDGPIPYNMAAS